MNLVKMACLGSNLTQILKKIKNCLPILQNEVDI